ncbi:hypothetical protein ACIBPB_03820 [Micromonospora sp. NPDC049836]|uniref:hypothetical protein n=1 Tax=Micromonospora sp. NPDC049836 TaxID=3364274 RepID=UPI0037B20B89
MILRLRCPCGRNLADVTRPGWAGRLTNPDWTRDGLLVTPRPNVRQQDYRPWEAANHGDPAPETAWDWHDRTYRWECRCGETWKLRHERITAVWARHTGPGRRSLVVVTLSQIM